MADIVRDVFLGFVRVHLLHHASRAPIYGLQMIEELGRHGYTLSPGTLYPIFHSLEEGGLLESRQAVVEGKVRKYYRITPAGRKALAAIKPKVRELVDEALGDVNPASGRARTRRTTGGARRASRRIAAGPGQRRAQAPG
jgi:DNA-binding PadR family transcriptional regulator